MIIYRNSYYSDVDGHAGYEFFPSKQWAEREFDVLVDEGNCAPPGECAVRAEPLRFEPTRTGILDLLNDVANHNDNG
jgi:hypothetical protein